jgi:hypothetical protein
MPDTRRYQWMIGGFGLLLVVAFSIFLSTHGGGATPGVPTGRPLHFFVAPLAASDLDAPANAHPRCDPRRPARRGLNVCGHRPIVLAFFALDAGPCEQAVTTMQRVARRFPRLQFAAVAVDATRSATERVARARRWTIPVAYDVTGVIGQLYGVSVCPLIELAGARGIVAQRLIGEAWERPQRLAAAISRFERPRRV